MESSVTIAIHQNRSVNSQIEPNIDLETVTNTFHDNNSEFLHFSANSEIQANIDYYDEQGIKVETLSTAVSENTSTSKPVKSVSLYTTDESKSCPVDSEIQRPNRDSNSEPQKSETLSETFVENKWKISKNFTLGFALSVVCILAYYFSSGSLDESAKHLDRKSLVNGTTTMQKKSILSTSFSSSTIQTKTVPRFVTGNLLTVSNGDRYGRWFMYGFVYCDPGTYAFGFSLKVDNDGGMFYDDSGVTNLALSCKKNEIDTTLDDKYNYVSPGNIENGFISYWRGSRLCKLHYYLVAFQLRVDRRKWYASDHTGVTNINFVCRGPGLNGTTLNHKGGDGMGHWGIWGAFSAFCENGTAICGMRTKSKVEPYDKLGMTDLQMMCCKNS